MTIWAAIPLTAFIAYLVLLLVTLPSVERRENRTFAIFLTAAATWSFSSFMLHLNAVPDQALLWNQILTAALVWQVISYYHFIRAYVRQSPGSGVYLGYVFVVVLTALCLGGYVVRYSYVINGVLYHSLGISIYFIGAACLIFISLSIAELVRKYRKSVDGTERNRIMYLITGWVITVTLGYTNLIPPLDAVPLDHIGTLSNALIIAYTISRFRLLDIRYIMRRGLTYLIVVASLAGIYVGALFLAQVVFPGQPTYVIVLVTALLVVLLSLSARPLRETIQESIDRLYYRETYAYRQAMLSISAQLGNIIDLNELAGKMLPTITNALRSSKAQLMFQHNGGGNFTTRFSYPNTEGGPNHEISFDMDNPIVTYLQRGNDPLDLKQIDSIPQLKGVWQTDREKIAASGLELLYPIKSRDILIGILALGKKQKGGLYTSEEVELVKSLAGQAGIIIENARVYDQAMTWANVDGLTELYNHRHFHERLDQEVARGSRFGTAFSLVMLDLDNFKSFNDSYGHLAGDEILRKVGRQIRASIRSIDMAFRYGGEEFAVILPGTQLSDAARVAERIRKTIESISGPGMTPLTASLGISSWPIDGMNKEELIARADAALYQAKQDGKNRTCLSSEVARAQISTISAELETKTRALSIIYALAATVDAKDHYTYGHSRKVSQYAVNISEAMGLAEDRIATIRAAALLHDIGKIAIPDSVLNKPGPLTEQEWELIKTHPELGGEILKHVIDLVNCLPAILHHHERYDGSGYPAGLKGEEIPLDARILAIADAYDAITSIRSYHAHLTPQDALDELKRCAGTQFDPELVSIFCQWAERRPLKELEIE